MRYRLPCAFTPEPFVSPAISLRDQLLRQTRWPTLPHAATRSPFSSRAASAGVVLLQRRWLVPVSCGGLLPPALVNVSLTSASPPSPKVRAAFLGRGQAFSPSRVLLDRSRPRKPSTARVTYKIAGARSGAQALSTDSLPVAPGTDAAPFSTAHQARYAPGANLPGQATLLPTGLPGRHPTGASTSTAPPRRKTPRMKPSFYAVAVGRARGIYSTWAQCSGQVLGHAGSVYKGFRTLAEARAFLAAHPEEVGSATTLQSTVGAAGSAKGDNVEGEACSSSVDVGGKGGAPRAVSRKRGGSDAGNDGVDAAAAAAPPVNGTPSLVTRRPKTEKAHNSVSTGLPSETGPCAPEKATPSASSSSATAASFQVVYVDGACSRNGTPLARAGYGGFYGTLDDPRNFSCAVPLTEPQTNNRGELRAVIHAIQQAFVDAGTPATALMGSTTPIDTSVTPSWFRSHLERPLYHLVLYTDSRYVMDGLTRYAQRWVANGFRLATKEPVQNQDLWKQLIQLRDVYNTLYAQQQREDGRVRCGTYADQGEKERADVTPEQYTCYNTRNRSSEGIELIHVKGHSKVTGNEMADSLAVSGSRRHLC